MSENSDQHPPESGNPFATPQEPIENTQVGETGSENPYSSPRGEGPSIPYRRRRNLVAIVLGLLTVPAAGLAFFVTCYASGFVLIDLIYSEPAFIWIALLIGVAAAISTVWMMVKLILRTLRQPTVGDEASRPESSSTE